MSVTLGLLLVLTGPTVDPEMGPPAAGAPPPVADASPSPPPGPSPEATLESPPASAPASVASTPTVDDPSGPPALAIDPVASAGRQPGAQPMELVASSDDPTANDPSELVGWMGYQSRTVQPLPPPPPAVSSRTHRRFVSGYGGPSGRLTALSGKLGTMAGFRGGVLLGERLSVGAAAYRLTYRHNSRIEGPDGEQYSLRMGYGGMTLGLTVWRPGRMELAVESLVGIGAACVSGNPRYRDDDYECVETVRMFVGEPAVTMYINVTDWMRIALTAGYRLVVREAWRPPTNFTLSGGYGGADLQFGWFRKPRRR